jgi:biopolymer transport protein ExbD
VKLETTLPEGVGFLHAVPLFNLFMVLLMCYALGPRLEEKTGITVNLPSSLFQMERFQEAAVLTLTAEGAERLYLGTQSVSLAELDQQMAKLMEQGNMTNASVVIKADRLVSSEALRQVAEICMRKGFRVVLAGGIQAEAAEKKAQ